MGTFRSLDPSDVDDILGQFGLPGRHAVQPIAAGTVNTNFAVDLAGADAQPGGRRFMRINEGKARVDVEREAAVIEHVAARGVKTPQPLHARSGLPFAIWQGCFVSLFPWVDGHTLRRDQVGPAEARAAGEALARLHAAGADFPDHATGRYETDEIERRAHGLAGAAAVDPVLAAALAIVQPTLAALRGERQANLRGLPQGLIHGDLFIDNVLYGPAGLSALLDFEQASWGLWVYDMAVSVLAFGFGRDDFRADVTRAFIDGYRARRAVSSAEDRAFGAELRFACCRFAITRITDVYQRRGAGAPGGKDFGRYLQRLAAVERHLAADDGLLRLI